MGKHFNSFIDNINNIIFFKLIKLIGIKNLKTTWKLEINRSNGISDEGAANLGEYVSKLRNLTILNINF